MRFSEIPARIRSLADRLTASVKRRFADGKTPVYAAVAMGLLSLALLLFFLLGERTQHGERFAVPDDDGILTRETRVHPRSPLSPAVNAFRSGYVRKAIGLLQALLKKPGLRIPEKRKVYNYIGYLYLINGRRPEAGGSFQASLRVDADNPPALHGLGRIAQIEKRYKGAVRYFQEAIRVNPRFRKSHWRLGQSLFALKRYADAVASFNRSLALLEDARVRYELGNALLAQGRPSMALLEYKRVLDFSPNRILLGYASARIGDIHDDSGKTKSALQYYRLAVRYYPDKFAFSHNLGLLLLKSGDRDGALKIFRSILPRAPDKRMAALARTLGELYYDARQYSDALRFFRISLKKQDDLDVAAVLGDIYYLKKDYEAAIHLYEQIITRYPDAPQAVSAMINSGNIRLLQEQYDEALRHYTQAAKQEPRNSRLWYNMGIVFWRQKLYERAESAFLKAAGLDPLYDAALRSASLSIIARGDTRRALNLYLTTIANRGSAASGWLFQDAGGLFRRLKEYGNAIRFLKKALKLAEKKLEKTRTLHEMARVYLDKGESAKMFAILHEARRIKAGDPLTGYLFALGLVREGRYREAAESLETALLYHPDDALRAEIHFQSGSLLLRRGEYGEALVRFRKTLDLEPAHSAAQYNASVCVRALRKGEP